MDVVNSHDHILGKHTVHILPHATVDVNPLSSPFCLTLPHSPARWPHPPLSVYSPSSSHQFHVPILVNNSIPYEVTYEITPLSDHGSSKNVTTRNIIRVSSTKKKTDDYYDDVEDEEDEEGYFWPFSKKPTVQHRHPELLTSLDLSPMQSLYTLPISLSFPAVIKVLQVTDKSKNAIRVRRRSREVFVVECPSATILPHQMHRCTRDEPSRLLVKLRGTPPFSFRWHSIFSTHKQWLRYTRELEQVSSPSADKTSQQRFSATVDFGGIPGEREAHSLDALSPPDFDSPFLVGHARNSPALVDASDYSYAESTTIDVPLNVSHSRTGVQTFKIDEIVDAFGNRVDFASMRETEEGRWKLASDASKRVKAKVTVQDIEHTTSLAIHPHPQVTFIKDCARGLQQPLKLIKDKQISMHLKIDTKEDDAEEVFSVDVDYFPPGMEPLGTFPRDAPLHGSPQPWSQTFQLPQKSRILDASQEGTYELKRISGTWCPGEVKNPSICTVVEQPLPSADLSFTKLEDACAGEIGFSTSFAFTGTPPFTVHYEVSDVTDGKKKARAVPMIARFKHVREEQEFKPERDGKFEYVFKTLDDADYKGISLNDATMTQHVKPLASARFVTGRKTQLRVCGDSKEVEVRVELTGKAPWILEYAVAGQKAERTSKIDSEHHVLKISIPKRIAKSGGSFVLALVSVTDERNCQRPLTGTELTIEVLKSKPTAAFYTGIDGKRWTSIRLSETAKLPLRLAGEAPWKIVYQRDGSDKRHTAEAKSANDELTVDEEGTWRLLEVKDAFCPGQIVQKEADFVVERLPQPKLELSSSTAIFNSKRGAFIREAVCRGSDDSVQLMLTGSAPYTVSYDYTSPVGGPKEAKSFQTIQDSATLVLQTDEAGRHTYDFTGIADFIYPQASKAGIITHADAPKRLRLEQTIYPLPTASLSHPSNGVFCVNDRLASTRTNPLLLKLEGEAPFKVELELREEGSSSKTRNFILEGITKKEMELDLDYQLDNSGRHQLFVRSVEDKNCRSESPYASTLVQESPSLITFEVAETAAITPVQVARDHCVGDKLEFVLQGSAPWTVVSQFNKKTRHINVKTPKFTRVAEAAGTFQILSVSHRGECESGNVNIWKEIHDIPTVKVSEGKNWIEDIQEGDQTQIVFTFTGEPPFSFTYNRMAPQDRSRDKTILESHTVSGIDSHTYSIYTSQEGTWTVSFISDKYCAFPPLASPEEVESQQYLTN
ncbi:hypothetical protein BT69DRAFT_1966 [Atractiella rhizophila]|nr:hypothetical protein BT69DRAFT_1966 [Atractiella rhizophila]